MTEISKIPTTRIRLCPTLYKALSEKAAAQATTPSEIATLAIEQYLGVQGEPRQTVYTGETLALKLGIGVTEINKLLFVNRIYKPATRALSQAEVGVLESEVANLQSKKV